MNSHLYIHSKPIFMCLSNAYIYKKEFEENESSLTPNSSVIKIQSYNHLNNKSNNTHVWPLHPHPNIP